MSELAQQITDDMKQAMRDKNAAALNVIRMLKSSIKNTAIDKGGADAELNDDEVTVVIRKEVKKRQDSIEQYEKAGRDELAQVEKDEIEILNKYLPEPLSEDELAKLIDEAISQVGATSRKEMGQVMGILSKTTEGRADGKTLSQAVMAKLS